MLLRFRGSVVVRGPGKYLDPGSILGRGFSFCFWKGKTVFFPQSL